jgi:hypothetical protein
MSDTGTGASPAKVGADETVGLPDGTGAPAISNTELTRSPGRVIPFLTQGATALAPIDIDRLYDAAPGASSQIVRVLDLLKQASDLLETARKSDNPLDADRCVQRVQLLLPKLFAYRGLGDGYGVIINSLHFGLANLQGTPLTSDQRNAVWRILRELRNKPAMTLEQGVQRVEEFEACGLGVDPPDVGVLLEESESTENE